MRTEEIVGAIDKQIAQWQQARELLVGTATTQEPPECRGRPEGSVNKTAAKPTTLTKRVMSAEGKARIAAAPKQRWASPKKSSKKAAVKKSVPKPKLVKKTTTAAE